MNNCSKPGCARSGSAVLGYDYGARLALLQDPPASGEVSPHLYILCGPCAERLSPPQGWSLEDSRSEPPLFVARDATPMDLTDLRRGLGVVEDEEEPEPLRRQLFFGASA